MSGLQISTDLSLPIDAVTQTFAIIAQRRKGKTYTATVMAEEMKKAGLPWVALDPTGAWWGLRSSADGKKAGLPVVVFGGDHGDLPLERTAGKAIADLVIKHPGWYILDFSHFESKEAERQLATDFAERFYRQKSINKTPMHLFVDEADMFAPQRTPAGDQRMLGAFESIVRRGGIRGIGTTLITQRAAVLNKNVLEQIDVLIALRTVGPNDRKAIAGYVEAFATSEQQSELMGSIASLDLGEAWVWEPGADLFQRVNIRKRETFNSSATPKAGDVPQEIVTLAKVDLAKIRDQMAATVEQVKENDPKELRKQVTTLKKQLADRKPQIETHQVEVLPVGFKQRLHDLHHQASQMTIEISQLIDFAAKFSEASDTVSQFNKTAPRMTKPKAESISHDTIDTQTELPRGAQRMLKVISESFPLAFNKTQMAYMAKMKVTSGTFGTYYSRLKREGYIIEADNGHIKPTDKTLAMMGIKKTKKIQSASEQLQMWREKLPAGAQRMLDAIQKYAPIDREALAETSEISSSSGTFGTYIGLMRRNNIIIVNEDGEIELAKALR